MVSLLGKQHRLSLTCVRYLFNSRRDFRMNNDTLTYVECKQPQTICGINAWRPSDAIWLLITRSPLVQVIVYYILATRPLPNTTTNYHQLNSKVYNSILYESKYIFFRCIWLLWHTWRPFCSGFYVMIDLRGNHNTGTTVILNYPIQFWINVWRKCELGSMFLQIFCWYCIFVFTG